MAHTKSGGSTQLGRDSAAQRLGVKLGDGQLARAGQIIVRQRGTAIQPGPQVRRGSDDTLYAAVSGLVRYFHRRVVRVNQRRERRTFVQVVPVPGPPGA